MKKVYSETMLNLANYVHPNFRLMWRRHKVQIAAIFCIFLAFYIIKDLIKSGKTPRKRTASSLRDDEFVMLRSQNGYLKVRKSQKQSFLASNLHKSKIFFFKRIFALATKMDQIRQIEVLLLY